MEEYTLDDAGSNSNTCAELKTSVPSEALAECERLVPTTISNVGTTPSHTISKMVVKDSPLMSHHTNTSTTVQPSIVYSRDNVDFYVEMTPTQVKPELEMNLCGEISHSAYPWKKEPVVLLRRLSDFDINLWCKTSPDVQLEENLQVETVHKTPSLSIKQELEVQMPTVVHVKGKGTHTGSK